jgi:HSF-type DNA-binding
MLVMLHMDKLRESPSPAGVARLPPAMGWCTYNSGTESDHVIVVNDCDRMVSEILPQFGFTSISDKSFVRKMYRWGFRQVSGAYSERYEQASCQSRTSYMYENEHFRKGNLLLLGKMESKTAEKLRRSVADQAEPERKRKTLELPSGADEAKRPRSDSFQQQPVTNERPIGAATELSRLARPSMQQWQQHTLLHQNKILLSAQQILESSILLEIAALKSANTNPRGLRFPSHSGLQFPTRMVTYPSTGTPYVRSAPLMNVSPPISQAALEVTSLTRHPLSGSGLPSSFRQAYAQTLKRQKNQLDNLAVATKSVAVHDVPRQSRLEVDARLRTLLVPEVMEAETTDRCSAAPFTSFRRDVPEVHSPEWLWSRRLHDRRMIQLAVQRAQTAQVHNSHTEDA